MSRPRTLDLQLVIGPEAMAIEIAHKYQTWKDARRVAEQRWTEARNYTFATDTSTTSNASLPWKNKTTRPKLCQIRDNLYANYYSALFPNDNWFTWEGGDPASVSKDMQLAIESYMSHIFRESGFKETVARLVYDFIDYGNCIADVEFVSEVADINGQKVKGYVGPKLVRISPLDIVFDLTAPSFDQSPKITRSLISMGQLEKLRRTRPEWASVSEDIMARIRNNRNQLLAAGVSGLRKDDLQKANALTADGFQSLYDYYNSNTVEVLEFEGDLFDTEHNKLYENHRITIIDRAYTVRKEPINNWFGKSFKKHCGWRLRPDNLMAMGPLENLIGLQYRIDHLENLKADVFDMIAFPMTKIKGFVEDFQYGPNERVYMEQDADVEHMHPDTTALNADMQIDVLERTMEEMAGAPKQAMGIRTPGEKTAFEVQSLDNAASRLFQSKISYFEEWFLEPLINQMLESARRNLDIEMVVKVVRDDLGVQDFISIDRDTITASGKLMAMGARHFAARAQMVQNLTQLAATGLYQDPAVITHMSGKVLAQLIEDNLGLRKYRLFMPNVRVAEQLETAQMQQQAQEELHVNAMTPTDYTGPGQDGGQAVSQDQAPNGPPSGVPDAGGAGS